MILCETADDTKIRYADDFGIILMSDNWQITIDTEAESGQKSGEVLSSPTIQSLKEMLKGRLDYYSWQWLKYTVSFPQMPTCRYCDAKADCRIKRATFCNRHADMVVEQGLIEGERKDIWSSVW